MVDYELSFYKNNSNTIYSTISAKLSLHITKPGGLVSC